MAVAFSKQRCFQHRRATLIRPFVTSEGESHPHSGFFERLRSLASKRPSKRPNGNDDAHSSQHEKKRRVSSERVIPVLESQNRECRRANHGIFAHRISETR